MKISLSVFLVVILATLSTSCKQQKQGSFNNGLAKVKDRLTGKYGFINKKENLVIQCNYDWVSDFSGYTAVVSKGNKTGVINTKEEIVIPFENQDIKHLNKDFFIIKKYSEGKTGIVDKNNKEIIPYKFHEVFKKHNDFVIMKLDYEAENKVRTLNQTSKYRYKIYDLSDYTSPLHRLDYFDYADFLNAPVLDYELLIKINSSPKKTAVIDNKGEFIIPYNKYDRIWSFSEDKFKIFMLESGFGFADKSGNLIIKPVFSDVTDFTNGISNVTFKGVTFSIDDRGNCLNNCPNRDFLNSYGVKSFSINKDKYRYFLNEGIKLSAQKEYSKALNAFTGAIQENPLDYEGFYNRGLTNLILNNLRNAEKDILKSIELNKNHSDSYYIKGCIMQKNGFINEAIWEFREATSIDPNHSDSFMKLAILYYKKGDVTSSCQNLNKACSLGNQEACLGFSKFCY